MPDMYLMGGGKGGVGKSWTCKSLCSWHQDRQIPFTLIECDRSNPDLLMTYGKDGSARLAVLSEGEKFEDSANTILNTALEQTTIVNLPAQVFAPLKYWLESNSIFDLAQESNVMLYHFYVSNGGQGSLSLFSRYVKDFGDKMPHIFVKNYGLCDDWESVDKEPEIQALLEQYQIPVITLPKFIGTRDRNLIDKLSLTFAEARIYEGFGPISRQRVKTYLNKAYRSFEQLPCLNSKSTGGDS